MWGPGWSACLHPRLTGRHRLNLGADCLSGGYWTWEYKVCVRHPFLCVSKEGVCLPVCLCVRVRLPLSLSGSLRCGGLFPPDTFPASDCCPHLLVHWYFSVSGSGCSVLYWLVPGGCLVGPGPPGFVCSWWGLGCPWVSGLVCSGVASGVCELVAAVTWGVCTVAAG